MDMTKSGMGFLRMKRSISMVILALPLFLSGAISEAGGLDTCRVLEVIQIHKSGEFTCRVDRWKGIDDLKLRVMIRNFSPPEEKKAADQIQQWLEESLKSSQKIMLKNIRDRNYFRVMADVQIDQIDLIEAVQRDGLIQPVKSEPDKTEEILPVKEFTLPAYSPARLPAKETRTNLTKPERRPLYSKESLEQILYAEVDLSGLDSNTPLKEALELIRLSVDPPLPLVIVWNDLQQTLFLDPETPIRVDGFTKIPLKLAIELILSSVSAGPSRPVLLQEDRLLLVVSSRFAARRMRPAVFDIGELAAIPIFVDEFTSGVGRSSNSNSPGSGR